MTDDGQTGGAPAERKTSLPKRFYKDVSVADEGGRFGLLLDGKPVRTPGKAPLAVSSKALAEAIADEWRAQGGHIDPKTMRLTKLANTAIDGVAGQRDDVIDDILAHARADLLCYRAGGPEGLVARQAELWDPVLAWARQALHAPLSLSQGIVHVAQPDGSIAALRPEIAKLDDVGLAALHVMTSLTRSALLGLAVALKRLNPDQAWDAAHVDEDFQIGRWGEDAEAEARRKARKAEFDAAARALELSELRPNPSP
ncbi:MAG: ATP12 family chaperone protein, partial [Methyloceanibacter sp.]|uniref:ATP12 family chaperone protein n=1 Tax=Methyloceanibacter sp. TaxID=1965321 RepID=UPI003EE2ABAE